MANDITAAANSMAVDADEANRNTRGRRADTEGLQADMEVEVDFESRRPPLAAPPVAAPPLPGPWARGRLNCPWCSDASFADAPAFMRHLSSRHAGRQVDQEMVNLLWALARGVCCDAACLGFRRVGTRQCHSCGATMRPPRVGDTVQGPQGTPAQGPQNAPSSSPAAAPSASATPVQDAALLADFTNRVRLLQPNTLVHIPVA